MRRWHYAWVIALVTFLALLVTAGVRNAPGIVMQSLEADFGWDRASISFAVAISLFVFGFGGPVGGSIIDRFGPRRVMLGGLILTLGGMALLLRMQNLLELQLLWGLIVGIGTGVLASVLGATVAMNWFNAHRSVVVGVFGAAAAAGQLLFVPLLIALNGVGGWQAVFSVLAFLVLIALSLALLFMRSRPQDVGLAPLGEATTATTSMDARFTPLGEVVRTRDFWLLAGSFFVCGYTTNGLIGTHLLPHTLEHGFVATEMSGAMAVMGLMNIFGTIASGWLTERYDNRKLLATYYGFRAISLVALPFILEMQGMLLFAIIYGLDWVATVPPTVNLTAQRFGRASLGTVYGWVFCSHMIGAGIASYAGGLFRDLLGDYHLIFISAAVMGLIAVGLSLSMSSPRKLKDLANRAVQPAA
jgi:sugar phosphate permease